jgi:hypothetical protein
MRLRTVPVTERSHVDGLFTTHVRLTADLKIGMFILLGELRQIWRQGEAHYGPVTSTTRKPTSESGDNAKRKSREADRQDELS